MLVERGLVPTRARAQALVLGGRVRVGDGDSARTNRKPGDLLTPETRVELVATDPYVSRGGHKLAAALDAFGVDPADRVAVDVGASTGGFTDVLLQRGARRVHAVDVGRGQLAEPLRQNPRVVSHERLNARTLSPEVLGERVSLAVIDVSFISLELVLAPVVSTFEPIGGDLIALVKPQFEAGRGRTDGGVVRDPAIHREVLARTIGAVRAAGLHPVGLIASPLVGPEGNREFLLHARVGGAPAELPDDAAWSARVDEVVGG